MLLAYGSAATVVFVSLLLWLFDLPFYHSEPWGTWQPYVALFLLLPYIYAPCLLGLFALHCTFVVGDNTSKAAFGRAGRPFHVDCHTLRDILFAPLRLNRYRRDRAANSALVYAGDHRTSSEARAGDKDMVLLQDQHSSGRTEAAVTGDDPFATHSSIFFGEIEQKNQSKTTFSG